MVKIANKLQWDAFDALFPPDQQIDAGFLPGVGPY